MSQSTILNDVADWPAERAKCRPIPLRNVTVSGFLGKRINANLQSVLAGLESPIPRGFEARADGRIPPPETNRLAADSDLYKWLEGAAYVYAGTGNSEIKAAIDRISRLILTCQEDDGYINTQVPPNERFDRKVNHDLYTAGHFFEAAVAHHRATDESQLLDAACLWADYILSEYEKGHPYFDVEPGAFPEHPEYELGFLRLSRETENTRYLDFSAKLARLSKVGPRVKDVKAGSGLHAVRFGYLLAGCADLYLETGDGSFYEYLPGLWEEMVQTRMYVTGGVGMIESVPERPYLLPQSIEYHAHRDIAETCASVAMTMWTWRMHAITAESRCFDVIETILYNHYLGAIALNNLGNFYYNPLRLVGDQTGMTDHNGPKTIRCMLPAIHSTACCIPNSWRFFGALPEYIFSYDERGIFVNLYTAGSVQHPLANGVTVDLSIHTRYPHDGLVKIRVENAEPARYAIRLRIPQWCQSACVKIRGQQSEAATPGQYLTLERTWQPGDTIVLEMDMPVRMIASNPRIMDAAGHVAFARGPLVYCLEQQDMEYPVENVRVSISPGDVVDLVKVQWCGDLLDGVNVLKIPALVATVGSDPYTEAGRNLEEVEITMIPFYTRANRSDDNRWITFVPVTVQEC